MNAAFPRTIFSALLVLVLIPSTSYATNGYFLIGYGSKSRAMGGASLAFAQDSLVAATNPAELVDVGTRVDADLAIFIPARRTACCVAPEGVVSGATLFGIPTMGGAFKFNRKLSLGFAAVGAGANTRYNRNFFIDDPNLPGTQPAASTVGVNLIQMIMTPGAAYNINKNHSVGAALQIGVQTFRAYGLQAFNNFTIDPSKLTNNGNDWSYGAGVRFGYRGKYFDKRLTLGVAYASKVYMTEFDKYAGLFAEHGDFDIPENYGIGIAFSPIDKLKVAFDVTRINYSDIASVGNPSTPISATQDPNDPSYQFKLGQPNGAGFEWDDMTVYKLGLAYDLNKQWTVRAGYNYAESPIPDGPPLEFATLAPATVEHHYTFGGTYNIKRNMEFNFAYMHAKRNRQSANLQGTDLPFNGDVTVELRENVFEIGFAYKL